MAVQFYGMDAVASEIEARGFDQVRLLQGKQVQYTGTPEEMIDLLGRMAKGGSDAQYTMQFLDDGKVDSAFNFKFTPPGSGEYGMNRMGFINPSLEARLAGIEKKLEEGKGDEDNGLLGKIGEYVENNEWAQKLLLGFIGKYLNIPGLSSVPLPTALAGVAEDEDRRIAQAIELLKQKDSRLGEHLMKLAKLDDSIFKMVLQQLDSM